MTIAITVALAVLVGVSLGLLGGGGSILTLPILVYVAGMDTKAAIASSLLVVGVTSAVAVVSHARAGRVQWRTGLLFGLAGMAGAYAGGWLGQFIPDGVLLVAFAVLMMVTAVGMLRGRRAGSTPAPHGHVPTVRVIVQGILVGLVTGILGAGGGFLIVPALTLLVGLSMPVAVGTSLLVIAMNTASGLVAHLTSVTIDWKLAAMVTLAAVIGSLVGGRFASRIHPDALRRAFGWFVLAMAAFIIVQELPESFWTPLPAVEKVGVAVGIAAAVMGLGYIGQRLGRRPGPERQLSPTGDESTGSSRGPRAVTRNGRAAAKAVR